MSAVKRMSRAVVSERDIQKLVTQWLWLKKIWHMRVQSGRVKSVTGGWIQLAQKGTADYIATEPLDAFGHQRVVWLELKRPKGGVQSPEQKNFAEQVRTQGHEYFIVSTLEDLVRIFP